VKLSLAVKILLVLLGLSTLTLLCAAILAFSAMDEFGNFALDSSRDLGNGAVRSVRSALTTVAEDDLLRLARNQAEISDSVFRRVQIDVDIMADYAAHLWETATTNRTLRSYSMAERPPDLRMFSVHVLPPDATEDALRSDINVSALMDCFFIPLYSNDTVYLSCGVGTENGLYRAYPWRNTYKKGYDPRKRDWYRSAVSNGVATWTPPYVSASMTRLIVSCAKSFYSPDGRLLGVVEVDITPKTINENIINTRVGRSGYAFLIDGSGNEVASPASGLTDVVTDKDYRPKNLLAASEGEMKKIVGRMIQKETGVGRCFIGKTDMYVAFAPIPTTGWSIGVVMPVSDIVAPAESVAGALSRETQMASGRIDESIRSNLRLLALSFAVALGVVVLVAMRMARRITKPIMELSAGAAKIGSGDLEHRLTVRTGDEIERLAEDFNRMAANLQSYIANLRETTAAKQRIESELQIAHKIQTSILPRFFPPFPDRKEFDLHASMEPAREVGGDFFDFFMIDADRLCLVVGDVSDKGIPASLFMAVTKTLIKTEAQQAGLNAADVLTRVNNQLCQENEMLMFVTVFCAIVNVRTGEMEFSNGGHNPPVLCRGGGSPAFMKPGKGVALAVMENAKFALGREKLSPGDVLFLYTDGINEAMNPAHEQFSYDRLLKGFDENKTLGMKDLILRVGDRVKTFAAGAPQSDDITMVSLRFFGPQGKGGAG
jgi:sigma-B regulation protein RsbU (phosphoserine phosphatase)